MISIEVFCPNCREFIEMQQPNEFKTLEMEGDYFTLRNSCPKCKEIAEVKVALHWKGL